MHTTTKNRWLLYGANGYTGRLVARASHGRGLTPIVSGRDAAAVHEVARQHGFEARPCSLDRPEAIADALRDVAVVAHCAGPFSATSRPVLDACLATRTHYVDITGEIAVFEAAHARHEEARQKGVVACPGVGFDVLPTDCVAAVLGEAVSGATHLALGFDSGSALSAGTAKTVLEGVKAGCLVRADGVVRRIPLGSRRRSIDFGRGPRDAVAISWGDVATAYYTTAIPNIEVFMALPKSVAFGMQAAEPLRGFLGLSGVQRALKAAIGRFVRGPDERSRQWHRTWVWGEARDPDGRVVTARLKTPNVYDVTVDGVLLAVERLLAFEGEGGFFTPSQLLGSRCVESLPGSGRIELS